MATDERQAPRHSKWRRRCLALVGALAIFTVIFGVALFLFVIPVAIVEFHGVVRAVSRGAGAPGRALRAARRPPQGHDSRQADDAPAVVVEGASLAGELEIDSLEIEAASIELLSDQREEGDGLTTRHTLLRFPHTSYGSYYTERARVPYASVVNTGRIPCQGRAPGHFRHCNAAGTRCRVSPADDSCWLNERFVRFDLMTNAFDGAEGARAAVASLPLTFPDARATYSDLVLTLGSGSELFGPLLSLRGRRRAAERLVRTVGASPCTLQALCANISAANASNGSTPAVAQLPLSPVAIRQLAMLAGVRTAEPMSVGCAAHSRACPRPQPVTIPLGVHNPWVGEGAEADGAEQDPLAMTFPLIRGARLSPLAFSHDERSRLDVQGPAALLLVLDGARLASVAPADAFSSDPAWRLPALATPAVVDDDGLALFLSRSTLPLVPVALVGGGQLMRDVWRFCELGGAAAADSDDAAAGCAHGELEVWVSLLYAAHSPEQIAGAGVRLVAYSSLDRAHWASLPVSLCEWGAEPDGRVHLAATRPRANLLSPLWEGSAERPASGAAQAPRRLWLLANLTRADVSSVQLCEECLEAVTPVLRPRPPRPMAGVRVISQQHVAPPARLGRSARGSTP